MKYAESNAIGDAGEHLFAFMIATILGWPCRLLDVDIGIDAQVEILDDDRHSTGQFLAVQVKATNDSTLDSKSVSVSHIKYWKTVESPVLVALVDIKKKKVYIKHIDKGILIAPQEYEDGNYKIQFDKKEDLLCIKHKFKLRKLAFAVEIRVIEQILSEVRNECEQILQETDQKSPEKMIVNHAYYLDLTQKFRALENSLHKSKILVDRIHQSVGDCGYKDVLDLYYSARKSLEKFFDRWQFYDHNNEVVKGFKNDSINSSLLLELNTQFITQRNLTK